MAYLAAVVKPGLAQPRLCSQSRDYVPELIELDRRIMPKLSEFADALGEFSAVPVPVPHDCIDGFLGAFWRRPHVYLDPIARTSMSSFAKVDAREGLARLASDLENGARRERYADLLDLDALDVGYRLLRWEFT